MNNNIGESYCSFEVSKLLKDKGFGVPTGFYWTESLTESYDEEDGYSGPFGWKNGERALKSGYFYNDDPLAKDNAAWFTCSAPTHALVIEWLRVNFGIWITITSISQESWQCHITKKGDSLGKLYFEDFYTPQEATEAALKYVLEGLV